MNAWYVTGKRVGEAHKLPGADMRGACHAIEGQLMFMRVDKLQAELPKPKKADPVAAAALQELIGGKYGEMSTLNNYMFRASIFAASRS